MSLISLIEAVKCKLVKTYLKVKFGQCLEYKEKFKFRSGFKVIIEEKGMIKIGTHCFFNNNCSVNCMDSIVIGDYCIFGESVKLYDHNHCYADRDKPIANQGFSTRKIVIGNNCWVGSNVIILPGVTIGNHCVIGAGCVVYKNIPNNSVVLNGNQLIIKKIMEAE